MKTTQEPMVYRKKLEVQFGVSGDITSCISCNHDVEDSLHVSQDCAEVKSLWLSLVKSSFRLIFFKCDVWQWCFIINFNEKVEHCEGNWKEIFNLLLLYVVLFGNVAMKGFFTTRMQELMEFP